LKYFFLFRNFEQLALVLKTEFALKFFQSVGSTSPRLVRLWAYGMGDENTIFYMAWKMAISRREKALCPLNGLCLFG